MQNTFFFREGGDGGSILRDVEVFASGTHRGKSYTPDDLDQIVANFDLHSSGETPRFSVPMAVPRLMPGAPAVLGHEEEQKILSGSDLPAAGWPVRLWHDREEGKLMADIGGVAPVVANAIRAKRYKKVSAEIYDQPPEGVPGEGKMLRRISFLGADVPQVKTLADLPMPEEMESHSEQFAFTQPFTFKCVDLVPTPGMPGCYTCFFEGDENMNRDEMIDQLQSMGVDTSMMDEVPDAALAEILRACQSYSDGQKQMYDESMPMDGDLPDASSDEEAQTYADKWRRWGERAREGLRKYCGVGDGSTTNMQTPGDDNMSHNYSESVLTSLIESKLEQAINRKIKPSIESFEKYREETLLADKQNMVRKFFERNGPTGSRKLSAADCDEGSPFSEISVALRNAKDNTVVHKFSEKGKEVALTELDCQLKRLETRVPMKFGEVTRSSTGGANGDAGTEGETVVRAYFERFTESARAAGYSTADEMVETLKTASPRDREELISGYRKILNG